MTAAPTQSDLANDAQRGSHCVQRMAMPTRPKMLDLCCCGGGAGYGYKLAGYDVTGVDIKAQPKYPMRFVLADALEYLREHGDEYDAIHASPPCQGYSHLTPAAHRGNHAKLIPAMRELLLELGKPYIIENVAGARHELRNPVMLCGSMFGLRTQRHRYFETNFPVAAPCACDHSQLPLLVTTASKASRAKRFALGMKPKSVTNAPAAYGIDWMGCAELKEAIPPAYTLHIGRTLMRVTARHSTKLRDGGPRTPA
jgi:DNA (cytosine-5)-methyltransferase 1